MSYMDQNLAVAPAGALSAQSVAARAAARALCGTGIVTSQRMI